MTRIFIEDCGVTEGGILSFTPHRAEPTWNISYLVGAFGQFVTGIPTGQASTLHVVGLPHFLASWDFFFSVSPLQAYSQGSQLLLSLIQKTLFVLLASHPPTFTLTASTKVLDSTNGPSRFFFNRICHLWNTILALKSVILRFIVYFFHGEINSTQAFLEA